MRLLFTLWNHGLGGAEVFTRDLCAELASSGHDVHLLVLIPRGPLASTPASPGVKVRTLSYGSSLGAMRRPEEIRRALRDIRPECVFVSAYDLAIPVLGRAGYDGPLVVVEHGGTLLNPQMSARGRYRIQMLARRSYSSRVSAEIAVSRFMYTIQLRLPHAPHLFLVPNGVDPVRFAPHPGRPARSHEGVSPRGFAAMRVGAAGTLTRFKGFDTLLLAAAECRGSGVDLRLDLAGDGPDRPRLEWLIRNSGLGEYVRMLGRTTDMPRFYHGCDVVVVPSSTGCVESFNLVAVEAQSCAVPVVASRVGALSEVVSDGRTGRVCDPDSASGIADALRQYSTDPSKVAEHGRAARRRVMGRYTLARAAAGYSRVASEAVSRRRST